MRILIIEDEPLVALVASDVLGQSGHEIVGVAATVTTAIALALAEKPDLLLVDLNLRNGDCGADAISEIRSSFRVPALFVSGSSDECRRFGYKYAYGCLKKPYYSDQLTVAVEAVMAIANGATPPRFPANLEVYEPITT